MGGVNGNCSASHWARPRCPKRRLSACGMTILRRSITRRLALAARVYSGISSASTNGTCCQRLPAPRRIRTRSVLRNHLVPEFGGLMLRELTLEKLQGYYTRLQSTNLSAESVDKIRDVHSAVMRTAADYGRIGVNPLEKVRLKRRRLDRAKPFLRAGQFFALAEAMAEPYASMVYVAAFTGLRVSELASAPAFVRHVAAAGGRRCERRPGTPAAQPRQHDAGHLSADRRRVATPRRAQTDRLCRGGEVRAMKRESRRAVAEVQPIATICSNSKLASDWKMVARDGLEPPTPAFSGPRSTS